MQSRALFIDTPRARSDVSARRKRVVFRNHHLCSASGERSTWPDKEALQQPFCPLRSNFRPGYEYAGASFPSLSLAQLVPSPTAAAHRLSKALFDNQRAKSRVTMKRQDAQLGLPLPDSVCDRNHFDMIFPFNYRDGQLWYLDFFAVLFFGCIRKSLKNK